MPEEAHAATRAAAASARPRLPRAPTHPNRRSLPPRGVWWSGLAVEAGWRKWRELPASGHSDVGSPRRRKSMIDPSETTQLLFLAGAVSRYFVRNARMPGASVGGDALSRIRVRNSFRTQRDEARRVVLRQLGLSRGRSFPTSALATRGQHRRAARLRPTRSSRAGRRATSGAGGSSDPPSGDGGSDSDSDPCRSSSGSRRLA